jgi:hypothetical protein
MRAYVHKYHAFYPLNIYVGYFRKKIKSIKSLLHFWSFAVGFQSLMKKVDKEIQGESDQLKPK